MIKYKIGLLIIVCLFSFSCYSVTKSSTKTDGILYNETILKSSKERIERWEKFDQSGLIEKGFIIYDNTSTHSRKVKKKKVIKYDSVTNKIIYKYFKCGNYVTVEGKDSLNHSYK